MKTKFCLTIILGLLLAGCSSYQQPVKGAQMLDTDATMRLAETQLASSATAIQNSLFELEEIQKVVYPAAKLPDLPDADKLGMGHLATIDWTGPIEPLVRNIAKVTYYQVRVLGKPPAIPIIVSLSQKSVPLATVLRNAGYQCDNRASIVVYPRSRIIELRYAKV
ncbi:MAG: type IVB secretion system lipoprotein DotD [Gammaproteobacteria bacterium]|nr:type IVB secretion system lipoprotein DotD [Gammaproteobacteria bacterium]